MILPNLSSELSKDQILFDEADALSYLKVSKRTLANWRASGKIPYGKIGGKIYYRLDEILEKFESSKCQLHINPKF